MTARIPLPKGWLAGVIADAEAAIAARPPEERARMEAWARHVMRPDPDPCLKPSRCHEAQTCVGGCGLYNTTGMR